MKKNPSHICQKECGGKCCQFLIHKKDQNFVIRLEDDIFEGLQKFSSEVEKISKKHNEPFDAFLNLKKIRFWIQAYPGVGEGVLERKNVIVIRYDLLFSCSKFSEGKCTAYEYRPKVCRDFFCSKLEEEAGSSFERGIPKWIFGTRGEGTFFEKMKHFCVGFCYSI